MKIKSLCVKFVAAVLIFASFALLVACDDGELPIMNPNETGNQLTDINTGTATQTNTQTQIPNQLGTLEIPTGIVTDTNAMATDTSMSTLFPTVTDTSTSTPFPAVTDTSIDTSLNTGIDTSTGFVTDIVTNVVTDPIIDTSIGTEPGTETSAPNSNPVDSMEPTKELTFSFAFGKKSFLVSGVSDKFKGDTIVVPATYTNEEGKTLAVTGIKDRAFKENKKIKAVYLPSSIQTIGNEAFFDCVNLKDIPLPEGLKTIGSRSFAGCIGLTKVVLPNTVTKLGEACYNRASKITSIELGSAVTSINRFTFYFCNSLTQVKYYGTPEQWKKVKSDSTCYLSTEVKYILCEYTDASGQIVTEKVATPKKGETTTSNKK